MRLIGPVLLSCAVLLTPALSQVNNTVLFAGCHPDLYYANLTSKITPSRTELGDLLRRTHRRRLPYTDDEDDDVWKALMDLDAGQEPGTVRLVYSQVDVLASLKGDPSTGWNREHLWPKSHGVGESGMDFTDIHHLRPSDWNVNAARGNKYFGDCQIGGGTCESPATAEAANDTAASRYAFLPPASVRGDIARALFYMELRYNGAKSGEADLHLTDCPAQEYKDSGLAYRSQLLQWHMDDPVSDEEIIRNNKACERWQGNRNPFVDNRFLADVFYGQPQQIPYDCDFDDPGEVSCAGPGAVMIIGINSDNPVSVAMVAMEDLPANMMLFLTDNPWKPSGDFGSNEGIVSLRVPSSGISRGTVFGFGETEFSEWQWERPEGNFLLSASGDTLVLYCRDKVNGLKHIAGLSYGGFWTDKGGDSTKSALPEPLINFEVTLQHVDNLRYNGPTRGPVDVIRDAIVDSANWESNDVDRFTDLESMSFRLSPPSAPTDTSVSQDSGGTGTSSDATLVGFGLCSLSSIAGAAVLALL